MATKKDPVTEHMRRAVAQMIEHNEPFEVPMDLFGMRVWAEKVGEFSEYSDEDTEPYYVYRYETLCGRPSEVCDREYLDRTAWDYLAETYVQIVKKILANQGYTWDEARPADSGYKPFEWEVRFLPHKIRYRGNHITKVFELPPPTKAEETLLENLRRWDRGDIEDWEILIILDRIPEGVIRLEGD